MKFILFLILLSFSSFAQSVRLGDVNNRNVIVVTNEEDRVAMAAVGVLDTNTVTRAGTNGWVVSGHGALVNTNDTRLSDARVPLSHSQSYASITDAPPFITIDSVPASAFRLMIATNTIMTADTNGVVDLWHIERGLADENTIYVTEVANADQEFLGKYEKGAESSLWIKAGTLNVITLGSMETLYNQFDGRQYLGSATYPAIFYGQGDETGSVLVDFARYAATNHINRIASTNDVADAIAAWMNSDEAGQWVSEAAGSIAVGVVANHANGIDPHHGVYPLIANMPENAVTGWLVYDSGSNKWYNVAMSNLAFKVYEVSP